MYRVHYSPECKQEIRELRAYITRKKSRRVADAYLMQLRSFCQELAIAPHRGETRRGLTEHQRTVGFKRRVTVVFRVYDEQQLVRITGISYAGRALRSQDR